jgi:hypothetical protein
MKKNVLRVVKLLSLFLAIALTAGVLQEFVLCHADHNRQRVKGFFNEAENSLDVVLMGASEVYSDFAPGYAYKQDGITSYLFATQSNSILNYKSQLKNILSRQSPDVIVIELNGALYGDESEATKEANLHNYSDNIPLDAAKAEWLSQPQIDNKAEYLFPLIKYHGVWSDFPKDWKYQQTIFGDRLRGYNYLKGILNETGIFRNTQRSMNDMLPMSKDSKEPLTTIEESGLRDLLEYCRSENLKNVVFARFPHIVVRRTFSRFARSNTVADIVREYGFDYLNLELNFADTGLDEEKDFYNLDHLNIYGQKKFTAYLTDTLKKSYSLSPEKLNDNLKDEWKECSDYYDAYFKYSESLIKKGDKRELSEDCELIDELNKFIEK